MTISKQSLLILARRNPVVFYQYIRQALGQVERIVVGKLSDEQVLDLVLDHIRCGTIQLNLDNIESGNYFSVSRNLISEQAYMQRARARSSAPADELSDPKSISPAHKVSVNERTRWIAFQICDDQSGEPMADVALKIQLPDGNVRQFFSNAEGMVKIEGIDYGPLHVLEIKHKTHHTVSRFY